MILTKRVNCDGSTTSFNTEHPKFASFDIGPYFYGRRVQAPYQKSVAGASCGSRLVENQMLRPEDTPYFDWVKEFYPELVDSLRWGAMSEGEAEQIADQAVIAANKYPHEYFNDGGGESYFRNWTFRVAHNMKANEYRRLNRHRGKTTSLGHNLLGDLFILPQDPAVADALYSCFNNLPADQRLCLGMHEFCGLRSKEIGQWLGLDAGYVRNIIKRAKQAMKDCMQTKRIGPDDVF